MELELRVFPTTFYNYTLYLSTSSLQIATLYSSPFLFRGKIDIPNTPSLLLRRSRPHLIALRNEQTFGSALFTYFSSRTEIDINGISYVLHRGAYGVFKLLLKDKPVAHIQRCPYELTFTAQWDEYVDVEIAAFVCWCALWHWRRRICARGVAFLLLLISVAVLISLLQGFMQEYKA